MTNHLPECWVKESYSSCWHICARSRACESRVAEEPNDAAIAPLAWDNLFGADPNYVNMPSDYEQGQRDMLAKCIAAVEAWALENPYEHPSPNRIIAALRALQERP